MKDKKIKEENLDEIIKNVVKDMKKGKEFSEKEIDKLMEEANENLEFTKVINDIKLEAPDKRVILTEGNEQLLYDHGEFFICDTIDSRKLKKKIKRKEATERYIEYFIRYQLNPIIEQKNISNLSKTIKRTVKPKTKTVEKKTAEKQKTSVKVEPKQKEKVKEDLER